MKTKKFLAIAALAAGFVSCSSEDEFVSSTEKGEATAGGAIELSYATKAGTRAASDLNIGTATDFAPIGSPKDVRVVFLDENTNTSLDTHTYDAAGYIWTCENGSMTRKESTGIAYWPLRANPSLLCSAVYPADKVGDNFGTSIAYQNTVATIRTAVSNATDKDNVDLSAYNLKYLSYPTDQTSDDVYKAWDILIGMPTSTTDFTITPTETGMKFIHGGNKITVKLQGADTNPCTAEEMATAKVELLNFTTHGAIWPWDPMVSDLPVKDYGKTLTDLGWKSYHFFKFIV